MEHFLHQVAAHIGNKCDFQTRQNLLFAAKCCRDAHIFRTYHHWKVDAPCDLRIKMQCLLKFKTRLNSLNIIANARVQGLVEIALAHLSVEIEAYVCASRIDDVMAHIHPPNLHLHVICTADTHIDSVVNWLGWYPTATIRVIDISRANTMAKVDMLSKLIEMDETFRHRLESLKVGNCDFYWILNTHRLNLLQTFKEVLININHDLQPDVFEHLRGLATKVCHTKDILHTKTSFDTLDWYAHRCPRLHTITFMCVHATNVIANNMDAQHSIMVEKMCRAVKSCGTLIFKQLCLKDPGLITLVQQLSDYIREKRIHITIEISIEGRCHADALMGRLIHRHVKSIVTCTDVATKHEVDSRCTYNELLESLKIAAPRAHPIWNMIRQPQ
jgi:hypothetical protein